MQKCRALLAKYREQLSYLFFGALTTLLNFALLNMFTALGGIDFAAGVGNVLNNALCILFAYVTNRAFVFKSKSTGAAARREFVSFIGARLFTAVLDQLIMWLGVGVLGARLFGAGAVGGPDGPTALFSTLSPSLWANLVKLFSQVVVIVSNYVFSKWFVFKKPK